MQNLINFDWSVVKSNLKHDSPNLFLIMSNLMDSEKKQNLPVLITSLAVFFLWQIEISKSVTVHPWSNFRQMWIVKRGRLDLPVLLIIELKDNHHIIMI